MAIDSLSQSPAKRRVNAGVFAIIHMLSGNFT